jgi:hypothetical protein
MKTSLCLLSSLSLLLSSGCVGSSTLSAQPPVTVAQPPVTVVQPAQAGPQPLEELLAPIALYPDALIALILPAATVSSDVVLAARYLSANGDPAQVTSQPWDESVKGLTHYPEVVKWLDENLTWTQRVGEEYSAHPDEAMAAIQQARLRAKDKGILVNNPQQQVVVENEVIRIVPAQPDVIYVPRYDPEIIYVDQPVYYGATPWITFGIGFGVGAWLNYDCDWHRHVIWVDDRRWEHRRESDWRRPYYPGANNYADHRYEAHEWRSRESRGYPQYHHAEFPDRVYVQPTHLAGTPHFDRPVIDGGSRDHWRNRSNQPGASVPVQPIARGSGGNSVRPSTAVQNAAPVVQSRTSTVGSRMRQPLPWSPTQPIATGGRSTRQDQRSEAPPGASRLSNVSPAPSVSGATPSNQPNRTMNAPVARQADEPRRIRMPDHSPAPVVQPVQQAVRAAPIAQQGRGVPHVQSAPQPAAARSDSVVRSEHSSVNKDADHNHRDREQTR